MPRRSHDFRMFSVLSIAVSVLAFLGCLALARVSSAEVVSLRRADGNVFSARLAGDWSRCGPTLILSHGLGGDERSLKWMDRAATGAGYRLLAIEHRESGPRQLFGLGRRENPEKEVLRSPEVWKGRAADLAAAVAFARQDGCQPRPLVLGGHSMGAALTMFEAGARGRAPYVGQGRFDAYIAVSPQGLGWAFASRTAWSDVSSPVLMITGTMDETFGEPWQTRLTAFAGLPSGKKRLAIIPKATHLNLGGLGNRKAQGLAAEVSREFLSQIAGTWGRSRLDGKGGLEIREK